MTLAVGERLRRHMQQLPPEPTDWVPAEGVWTIMDNLCQIREFALVWTPETLRMIQRRGGPWARPHGHGAPRGHEHLHHLDAPARRRVTDIREAVRRSAETLRTLSDEQLATEAASRNPRWAVKPGRS